MDKAISINIEKCLACKSCEIACAVAHSQSKVLEEATSERPSPQSRVTVESAGELAVPLQCRHCEDAPCISVCPTAAIHRSDADGPVLIEKDRCIGCRFCLMACPFGVIELSRDGKVAVKCDFCIERTKAGQQPACVEACPTRALELASEKDLTAHKRKLTAWELVLATQQNDNKGKQKENMR